MTALIEAHGLARTFTSKKTKDSDKKSNKEKKEIRAVDGVDLSVSEGEIVGFLGPNGAGKTTTLRMLTTLLKPTAGSARVAGFDIATEPAKVRQSIGYVSQSGSTSGYARAGDEVTDHGALYGMTNAAARARGQELFAQLELDGLWQRPPRTLSGGQRRRLDIVMGLIHDPRLMFLDEPTTGLDPQARANLWTHVRQLREQQGATVFLTTHYMDEADSLADRIIIIDHGKIVAADTPDNLKASVKGSLIDLAVAQPDHLATAADKLAALTGSVDTDGLHVRGRVPRAGTLIAGLVRELDTAGVAIASLDVHRPTLDDVFLALTGRSLREGAA